MAGGFGPKKPLGNLGGTGKPAAAKPPAERLLEGKDGDLEFFWESEDPKRRGIPDLRTERRALDFLKALRKPQEAAATLRDFYKTHWSKTLESTPPEGRKRLFALVFSKPRLDLAEADEILAVAAAQIASGRLRLDRVTQIRGGSQAPPAEQAAPAMEKAARTKLTWVAIQLVDHEDEPVSGEAYELTLPDGAVRAGSLNGDGKAEERGIDAGTCKVRFPNLGPDEWEFIETQAG